MVLTELNKNKKILNATHNMYAYRINLPGKPVCEFREDDGENAGGDKMLYVLQVNNMLNVMVVVTRWYGGVHLGPDRFKHIQTVCQDILKLYANSKKEAVNGSSKRLTPVDEVLSRIKVFFNLSSSQLVGFIF
eukprot:TRINITY_DN4698_c0_g1_i2.p1 TRINITY_DN4698_c0_g1~~TRINITY_DN4698_c0_g1_i2.p1  ORF type:complete len:133 (+),score=17.81 TRINITY_DN4698_c0_g1_i2:360-758(+)